MLVASEENSANGRINGTKKPERKMQQLTR